jgi:hypothetical protein
MNLPLGTAGYQLRTLNARTALTRSRALDKNTSLWMALISDRPLEAHLWRPIVDLGAEAQHIFRT